MSEHLLPFGCISSLEYWWMRCDIDTPKLQRWSSPLTAPRLDWEAPFGNVTAVGSPHTSQEPKTNTTPSRGWHEATCTWSSETRHRHLSDDYSDASLFVTRDRSIRLWRKAPSKRARRLEMAVWGMWNKENQREGSLREWSPKRIIWRQQRISMKYLTTMSHVRSFIVGKKWLLSASRPQYARLWTRALLTRAFSLGLSRFSCYAIAGMSRRVIFTSQSPPNHFRPWHLIHIQHMSNVAWRCKLYFSCISIN